MADCLIEEGALGMWIGTIPDSSLTASSSDWPVGTGPGQARLHKVRVGDNVGAWLPKTLDANQWIQVDFRSTREVRAVATQGRDDLPEWVTSYKVSYSSDGVNFNPVRSPDGEDMVFKGNDDQNTVVKNTLPEPVECRYLRILPMTWYEWIALRMEIFGPPPVSTTEHE